LLVGVDAEAELGNHLVREQGVAGMDPAEPAVAEQLLETAALEDPRATGQIECGVEARRAIDE
jgi:hypothetical protein